ncbi:MAG: hypothetical protein R2991_12875 [Thermoanaerobaculia bacterium]
MRPLRISSTVLSLALVSTPWALARPASAQEAAEGVDRVVAVVDEDPILESEVRQVVELGLVEDVDGESARDRERRVLDRLIEQRVQFHEIDRFGFIELPTDEVERQFDRIRSRFDSPRAFETTLERVGLDAQGLRQIIARQIMVLIYVEERLGPRVFVGLDDIRGYYDAELVPEMRKRGQSAPPLEDVREQIRSVLREQRLNEEIERWTAELRGEADVVDYFESEHDTLPPVVARENE